MWRSRGKVEKYGFLLILLLLFSGLALLALQRLRPEEPRAIYFAQGNPPRVAITFETLWSSSGLEQVLSSLDEAGVRATFFITGTWLRQNQAGARQILARGHEIGNHTMNHKPLLYLNRRDMIKELGEFNTLAAELLEYRPRLFRPPLGLYNGIVLKTAGQQGLQTVLWSVDSYDSISESSAQIVQRVGEKAHGGAIILFRIGAPLLPEALPEILAELRRQGYEAVSVSELLAGM